MMKTFRSILLCLTLLFALAACSTLGTPDGDTTSGGVTPTENVLGLEEENPLSDALFNYGLVCVKVGDKWGFVNLEGEMVIEPQFDREGKFRQGLYAVNEDGTYRFINTEGEWVNEPTAGNARYFTEGYCIVVNVETDETGKVTAYRQSLIDATGEVCFELPERVSSWPVRDGVMILRDENGISLYTPQGEKLFELEGSQLFEADESEYRVFFDGLLCVEKDGKWGAVNAEGVWVIEPQFDKLACFENGVAKATVGDYYGYINTAGEWVVEPQFIENYDDFSEGLVGAETDDKVGYIDAQGNWKIVLSGFEWTILGEFEGGVASVNTDRGAGIINKDGEWVVEPTYRYISKFEHGLAAVETDYNCYGFINAAGEIVVPAEYRYTAYFYEDGYAVAQKHDGKWVILDATGKVILDGGFDGIGNYETYYEDDGRISMGYSR